MKEYVQAVVVFVVFLMLIPSIVFLNSTAKEDIPAQQISSESQEVKIYFTDEDKVEEFSMEEYMTGAVLAQMPADFEEQALCAQAVLARTYIEYRRVSENTSPTENLKGALLSDNTQLYQGFFTTEQAKAFYGNDYDTAYEHVQSAVKLAGNKILTYKDEPIIVAFHAISNGYTQSALTAWGQDIPYLKSVESLSDTEIEQAITTVTFTDSQLCDAVKKGDSTIDFTKELTLEIADTGEHSYVKSVELCGTKMSANEFCQLLDLSSQCFEFTHKDNVFTFTVHGTGHLVGMSQYGANSMAADGKKCDEILTHYFSGCKIVK